MNERDDSEREEGVLEPHEAQLLGRARRALGPTAADQARVLAQLLPALGVEPAAAAAPGSRAGASTQGLRYFWGALALGVAGMAGYGWGYRAGARAHDASAVASPSTATAVASSPSAGPATASLGARAEPEPVTARERAAAPEPFAATRRGAPASAVASGSAGSAGAAPPGLDEEVRQLRRIERAIREGNPRLALVIGEDLDRVIPRGQLLLERRAARAMAECQLEAPDARARAERFINETSSGAYAARVREICKLPEQSQRTGEPAGTNSAEKGGTR